MKVVALTLALLLSLPALAADVTGVPRIVDGDTIAIGETKIRLEGIDAPETDQLCFGAKGGRWPCGIAARDKLEKYAGGKPWTCHVHGQDRYGRSLATCEVAGEDIDRWMVREGWALSFVRYSHAYDADEKAGREVKARAVGRVFYCALGVAAHHRGTLVGGRSRAKLIWQPRKGLSLHPSASARACH